MTPTTAKRDVTEMETYTGKYVDLLDPKPEQICLADIAVGLANTPRFGGQVSRWYSVAEHSVRVSEAVEAPGLKLAGLLHDAHEAYTGDITAPLKRSIVVSINDGYDPVKYIQSDLDWAIGMALGVTPLLLKDDRVKKADDEVMFREAAGLKYSHGIGTHWGNNEYYEPLVDYGWTPAEAERRFIETYERLTQ